MGDLGQFGADVFLGDLEPFALSELADKEEGLGSLVDFGAEESLGVVAEVDERFQNVKLVSLSLTAAAILLSLILIFVVPGGINQTLGRLLQDAQRISNGDLSSPVDPSPIPEFNILADSLETIRKTELAYSQRTGGRS